MNKPDINTRLKIFNILVDNEIKSIRIDYILSSDSTFENYSSQDEDQEEDVISVNLWLRWNMESTNTLYS